MISAVTPRTTIAPVAVRADSRARNDGGRSGIVSMPSAAVGAQPVAGTPHGLDRTAPERPVDLVAEVADVDVDHVGGAVVREVPDVFEDRRPAEDVALAAQQQLQYGELAGRQVDRRLAAPYRVTGGIQLQIPGPEHGRSLTDVAPQQ